ncbi:MAG TPA: PAS domain S-box protein [Methanospirillum sp.]|nr:PAS domain S-box protein [Methanospirillum sp.]
MISVLLVDDEPVLLDLGKIFLERSGDFLIVQANSGNEAMISLSEGSFDAIVSDYEMPEMDGIALLRNVRALYPEIPFILFTGRGREEVVIEALNSGADFYLQKGGDPKAQFTELAHKIKLAVVARQASTQLRESEETFRQFFEAAGEAILIFDQGFVVDCNQRCQPLIGRERYEIIGRGLEDFSAPWQSGGKSAKAMALEHIQIAFSGNTEVFEWQIQRPDGTLVDTEINLTEITLHGKKILHAIIRDITTRKRDLEIRTLNELRLESMMSLYGMRDSSLKNIIDYALNRAVVITGSKYGYIAFVNDDESVMTIFSWSDAAMADCRVSEKPSQYMVSETGLWGETIRKRQAVITNDYSAISSLRKGVPEGHVPIRRHLGIPVYDGDHIVMVTGVANKEEPYDDEDVRQLTLLMTGLWGIVRRKKTEEILQRKIAELAAAYEQIRTTEENLRQNYDDLQSRSAELAESEERFRRLAEQAPVFIIIGDEAGHITYFNNAWRIFIAGTSDDPDELWRQTLHPDDRDRIIYEYKVSFKNRTVFSGEYRICHPSGGITWLLSTAIPRITPDGRFLGYIDVATDISDRKLMEQQLRENEERYRGLVERSGDLIILLTDQFILSYLSPSFRDITGYEPDDALHKPFIYFLNAKEGDIVGDALEKTRSRGQSGDIETSFRRKDGHTVFLELSITPINHNGMFTGVQIIARDISRRKEIKEELVQANKRLTLLADLTRHDILNNLTTLRGFLDLVTDEEGISTLVREKVTRGQEAIDGIRYLLEFSRDYQSLGLEPAQWIDAGIALDTAVSQLPIQDIIIDNKLSEVFIYVDPIFQRALYNLLENSIRHGSHVTIIRAYSVLTDEGMSIMVEDDGVGVEQSAKDKIFERGVGRNTGLGLFLVREILQSSGCTIREIGNPGEGVRFEIMVPHGVFRENQNICSN